MTEPRNVEPDVRNRMAKDPLSCWLFLPAILFALLGLLFILNFGVALIGIAAAILYYGRSGLGIAAALGVLLLAMLGIWMMLMPVHHLPAAVGAIALAAVGGRLYGQLRAGEKPSLAEWRQYLLAGPAEALALLRERITSRPKLPPASRPSHSSITWRTPSEP